MNYMHTHPDNNLCALQFVFRQTQEEMFMVKFVTAFNILTSEICMIACVCRSFPLPFSLASCDIDTFWMKLVSRRQHGARAARQIPHVRMECT
jgi:hypothetical protein